MQNVEPPPQKPIDCVPFVYGSAAFSLGKSDDGTTHRWTIYVRGVGGKDLSSVISKVVFKLHPTCTSPVVECLQHPFETTQPGWGEFPSTIDITFKDERQTTITLTHHLKLHHVGPNPNPSKPVVSETYEEAVFKQPGVSFLDTLQMLVHAPTPQHPLSSYWETFSDDADIEAIAKAHAFIKSQLALATKEYAELEAEVKAHKPAITSGNSAAASSPEHYSDPTSKRVRMDTAGALEAT
jgi:YEATS domain-containing protein 4